jgi:hypothetical protein
VGVVDLLASNLLVPRTAELSCVILRPDKRNVAPALIGGEVGEELQTNCPIIQVVKDAI